MRKVPNPLTDIAAFDTDDVECVRRAQGGSRDALEQLLGRHQAWIYNIVVRMLYYPHDAEDATQEILIKLSLSKLALASLALDVDSIDN